MWWPGLANQPKIGGHDWLLRQWGLASSADPENSDAHPNGWEKGSAAQTAKERNLSILNVLQEFHVWRVD